MSDYTTATGHDSEVVEIADGNQIRSGATRWGAPRLSCANRFRRLGTHLLKSDSF
jgi:hypothetical protein